MKVGVIGSGVVGVRRWLRGFSNTATKIEIGTREPAKLQNMVGEASWLPR